MADPLAQYRNHDHGDLILRTSDNVDFHVVHHRLADSLIPFDPTLPQPRNNGIAEKAVVTVSESSKVWEHIIPICHVTASEAPLSDLDIIHELLKTAEKYGLEDMMPSHMRYILLQPELLDKDPYRVYAVAHAHGIFDVALVAAQRTLSHPFTHCDNFEALSCISASTYLALLQYRKRCGMAAKALTHVPADDSMQCWISSVPSRWKLLSMKCSGACALQARTMLVRETDSDNSPSIYVRIRKSWLEYLDMLGRQLEAHPDASHARSTKFLEPVVASALDCLECRRSIYHSVSEFSKAMEDELRRTISKVCLLEYLQPLLTQFQMQVPVECGQSS